MASTELKPRQMLEEFYTPLHGESLGGNQTNLAMDACYHWQETAPFNYVIDRAPYYRKTCSVPEVTINCGTTHVGPRRINVESDLRGLNNILSRCNCGKCPNCKLNNTTCEKARELKDFEAPPEPSPIEKYNFLQSQDTREKRGCNTLSGISIDRTHYLPCNPQELSRIIIREPVRGGIDSRNFTRSVVENQCRNEYNKPEYHYLNVFDHRTEQGNKMLQHFEHPEDWYKNNTN